MSFFFGGRKKVLDLEAKLKDPDTGGGLARVSYKRYQDGGERFRLNVQILHGMPRWSDVELYADGEPVASVRVKKGRGKLERDESSPEGVPRLIEGQRLELRHEGQTRLAGVVEPD